MTTTDATQRCSHTSRAAQPQQGQRADDVVRGDNALQQYLKQLGFDADAIRDLQATRGMTPNGVACPETLRELMAPQQAPKANGTGICPRAEQAQKGSQGRDFAESDRRRNAQSGGNYLIKRGDCLSKIADAHGTTVHALMKANPSITDPDKIVAGRTLRLPGEAEHKKVKHDRGTMGAGRRGGAGGVGGMSGDDRRNDAGDNNDAFRIAKGHLGKNAGSLKLEKNGVGEDMDDWVPNNVNCANFVSGVLEQAGQISNAQHHNAVTGLMGNLDKDKDWKRVSLQNAKPGDVVSFKTPGGHHVVFFAGFKDGKPQFLGSNNVNADGTQKVSMSSMNYPILAIHHYQG